MSYFPKKDDVKTAFGEKSVAELTPRIQLDAVYGIRDVTDVETFTATGGSVAVEDTGTGREFKCVSGTSAGGYGVIRSKKSLRYHAGQGALFRWTSRYDTPQTNNTQRAGAFSSGNELTFGYDTSQNFGILHKRGGRLEIRTLTLTVAATGSETATVTLDGTAFTPAITSGSIKHNAFELASATYTGWDVYHVDETVIFIKQSTGVANGTYSYSSTGASTGTFAQTSAGVADTDTWILQSNWNLDKVDGSAGTTFTLDPAKGNVYQVRFQYLGYGAITFSIENPSTGDFVDVHIIEYSNANTSPSIDNPSMKVGWFSANTGGTAASTVELYGASCAGFVEGKHVTTRGSDAHVASQTSIGTTLTSVMSVRVSKAFNGYINLQEVIPKIITVAVEGTKPAVAEVLINPTLSGEPDWQTHNAFGIVEIETSALTVTKASSTPEVVNIGLSKTGNAVINVDDLRIRLSRGDIITLAVRATSGSTDAVASMSWTED